MRSASRASSPLLFGLAPRGVFRASGVATGAVGSYPTFSPLPDVASILGVAQVSLRDGHRAALRGRSILCGTFREQQHRLQPVLLSSRFLGEPRVLTRAFAFVQAGLEPRSSASAL